jgi:hypothetical protein
MKNAQCVCGGKALHGNSVTSIFTLFPTEEPEAFAQKFSHKRHKESSSRASWQNSQSHHLINSGVPDSAAQELSDFFPKLVWPQSSQSQHMKQAVMN